MDRPSPGAGIFDGEHHFSIEEAGPGRVRFEQDERFGGILVPLLWKSSATAAAKGFRAMNEALARRVTGRRREAAP